VVDLQTVSDDVTQYFPKGHRFFKTGDHGEVMYIVTSGEVEIVLRGKVLETVGIGSVFGRATIRRSRYAS
jgi:CRP-like cAMP-binding protein